MRMLLKYQFDTETANRAIEDGSMATINEKMFTQMQRGLRSARLRPCEARRAGPRGVLRRGKEVPGPTGLVQLWVRLKPKASKPPRTR